MITNPAFPTPSLPAGATAPTVAPLATRPDPEAGELDPLIGLAGASLLHDPDDAVIRVQAAFAVDGCVAWVRDRHEWTVLAAAGELAALPAPTTARLAADTVMVTPAGAMTSLLLGHGSGEVGLLTLVCHDPFDLPHADERALLDALARRFGRELVWRAAHQRAMAEHDRLRQTQLVDPITGTWTAAAFERAMLVEMAAAGRRGEPLSLAVIAIDGLDRINQAHGHRAGDAALAHVAAVLRANLRTADELGRIGGGRLGVLLPGAPLAMAAKVVDKLRTRVGQRPASCDGVEVPVMVRAGVTALAHDDSGELAVARARAAADRAASDGAGVAVAEPDEPIGAVATTPHDALVGATLGGVYRVVHPLARGASGVVYRGEDINLGRPVAVKVLRTDLAHNREQLANFRHEAAVLAKLRHDNLVTVHAAGVEPRGAYFVMELVEGHSLADVLDDSRRRGQPVDLAAVGEVVNQIADALEVLHGAGLIHRDIKPSNVIIDRVNDRAVVLDVGTAKLAHEDGHGAGTPGFASPESFAGEPESFATDVYALAATAYTLITGEMPFGHGDALAVLSRQLDAPPPPPSSLRPDAGEALDAVVLRALAVSPADRYASPGTFAMAMRAALRADAARAGRPTPRGELAIPAPRTSLTAAGGEPAADRPPPPVVPRHALLTPLTVDGPGQLPVHEPTPDPLGQVRGALFRVAAKVLRARRGDWWLRRVAEFDARLGEVLQPTLPAMEWRPLRALVDLLERPDCEADPFDLARTVGLGLMSSTFAGVWGAEPREHAPEHALAAAPSYWSQFFTAGRVELRWTRSNAAELIMTGPLHLPAVRGLVAGSLQRIAELCGAAEVACSAEHLGGERWRWLVAWCDDELSLDGDPAAPAAAGA